MGFAWLLRLLVVLLLVRAVWSFLRGVARGLSAAPRRPGLPADGVKLARDPVCGTFVEPSRALVARDGGATYYFCSDKCRKEFGEGRRI